MGKIDLKLVKDYDTKKAKNFVQTFNTNESSTEEGYLHSYPITITRLHDLQNYKFFFVNSKFQSIHGHQLKSDTVANKFQIETINVMTQFSIHSNLEDYTKRATAVDEGKYRFIIQKTSSFKVSCCYETSDFTTSVLEKYNETFKNNKSVDVATLMAYKLDHRTVEKNSTGIIKFEISKHLRQASPF